MYPDPILRQMSGNSIPMYNKLLENDLRYILNHTESLWRDCKGKTIFITGGTGFFGKWFLETISFLNYEMNLDLMTIVLSREPDKFIREYPYFKQTMIRFVQGDVRDYTFPKEDVHFIIHAGNTVSDKLNNEKPLEMFETIVEGTRHVLHMAKEKRVESFLFTSSGAVYGNQLQDMTRIPETYLGTHDCLDVRSAYSEGKRAGEMLCSLYHHQFQIPVKIARCFAFVGPYLPLDKHFAIGNFILNAIKGEDIVIQGDGTPSRSYLYINDLMIWLWTLMLRGKTNEPYNVGSTEEITTEALANCVAHAVNPALKIIIRQNKIKNIPPQRYVPNVDKIVHELGVNQKVFLDDALQRTVSFNRKTLGLI